MRYVRSFILAVAAVAILAPAVAAQSTTPLPYVQQILIGPRPDLLPVVRPICPDDSIWVRVIGAFPDACYEVAGVELIPPPYGSPLPEPPFVRIHVEKQCGVGCATVITPFRAEAILPALPARDYRLVVQLDEQCAGELDPPDRLFETWVPFVVERCDGTGGACVWGGWVHPGPDLCDATIGPGRTADVTFTIQSDVALAGLEGRFHLGGTRTSAPSLVVQKITPIGPASDMHLNWTRTPGGARFVLFAASGAPIPPAGVITAVPPVPILRLTLAPGGNTVPPITMVTADGLLGSDADGNGVPMCDIQTFAPVAARVCAAADCDFNRDGRTDIRDLVLMVRCLNLDGTEVACDPERFFDCNGDGERTLADVICCARRILGTSPCLDCPADSVPPTLAPQIRVRLGEPRIQPESVEVPLDLEGLGDVGGALVSLRFPADRYDAAIHFPEGASEWLRLDDVGDGEAAIGLLRMAPGGAPDLGPVVLRLTLRSGREHGGEVAVSGGEFSGIEGEPLEVSLGTQSLPLGGPARIALSEARPNPFTGETRIALTLDRAGSATLRVHDLSGRLVAVLHDGPLAAGAHSFTWRGEAADGSVSPAGIYFVRAASGGVGVTRKLVRLRD